ncbi:MAG: SdrD B-like domain-containing protein [Candidatus Geothermincolales bacterium]
MRGIEGYKYEDTNGNGELDDGDSPWEGVTIQLWRIYDGIASLNGTEPLDETVTDENGHFQFDCLDPGTYLVSEVLPEGSEPVGTTTRMVTVPAGQTVPVDPPFLNREQEEETGEISGWKYLDADGDGTVDEGEAGLPGVTVGLYRQLEDGVVGQWPETLLGWSLVAETVTGEDGGFSFTELEPGIYLVTEETPEGHYPTSPTSVEVALEGGQSVQVVFLNAPMPRLTGEKIEHPNEEPVEGVEFTLTRAVEDGPVAALTWSETRVTGPDGTFDFGWLMPGSYVLEETVPEGWEPMTDPRLEIDLGPGEIMHLVFINRRIPEKSSIYGFKWLDANGDGAHQAEEPGLGGVYIQLEGPDGFTASTVTGENGLYTFEDLQPGEYLVSETVPAGYYPTSSHEVGVNLDEGESERVDFLNAPYGSIWGLKWDDVDGNGAADPGEATIEGVPIRLMNSEGIVILITHTEADGSYSFPELEAGVYTVEEIVPFGYENTAPTYVTLYLAPGETARVDFFNRVPVAGEIITPPIPGPPSVTPPPAPQVAGETLPVTGAQLALLLAGAGLLLALGALLFVIGARVARNQEG